MKQVVQGGNDLPFGIITEKRLHQILLIPESELFHDPFCGVIARRENVVNMYDDAWTEYR
jgi:hypothetical protein